MSKEETAIDYDAPEPDPEAFVEMFHPETGGRQSVEQKAFDQVHSENGWVLASEYEQNSADTEAPVQVAVNAEQAEALGTDVAEVPLTETAPSHLAVSGDENPSATLVEEAAPEKSPKTPKEK